MKYLLCIMIINFVNVDCGLLNDVLTPVTEAAQNNALLNEYEQKDKEPTKKGLVTKVVEGLDTGVDSLTKLLGQGNKKDVMGKKDNETDKIGETPKKTDDKIPDIDQGGKNTSDIANNTLGEGNKLNDTKTDEMKNEVDAKKKDLESSTPSIEECKGEECKETSKPAENTTPVAVTKRVSFDGSQCPTGTERAHDNTCKEVQ